MIEFSDIKIVDDMHVLRPEQNYELSFYGNVFDQRGQETRDFLKNNSQQSFHLEYKRESFSLFFSGNQYKIDKLDKFVEKNIVSKVLIDATTLNSVELALILRAYIDACPRIEFDILYAEPIEYTPKQDELDACNTHAFSLSADLLEDSISVPGFKHILKKGKEAHLLIMVGFEKERLGAMLNKIESHHINDCTIVFGVPAFKPSMEIHSLMQNATLLDNPIIRTIDFTGANNPVSTFRIINEVKRSLPENEILELAPIGPSPSSLACALYAAHDKTVGLRYDFPTLAENRTIGIGKCSLYSILSAIL